VVKKVEGILRNRNAYGATFYEIGEHSPIAGIRNGMQAFKDAKTDVIVSVGGGSPIDASKAIIYNLQKETGGPFLPQIAIPTTLSAAEYTVSARILMTICLLLSGHRVRLGQGLQMTKVSRSA
jgi:alcohol dehydrogenase class IV